LRGAWDDIGTFLMENAIGKVVTYNKKLQES
jgi:hypothetical protein